MRTALILAQPLFLEMSLLGITLYLPRTDQLLALFMLTAFSFSKTLQAFL
jgi:hypothetical protein